MNSVVLKSTVLSSLFLPLILFVPNSLATVVKPVKFSQGWDEALENKAYTLSEGSQLIPLDWFLALESPYSEKLFVQTAQDYGLIPKIDAPEKTLPVGLAIDESPDEEIRYSEKKWVGTNCTACHTSNLRINGQDVLINGGGGQFDLQKFEDDLLISINQTLSDKNKFDRFLRAQPETSDTSTLRERMQKFRDEFQTYLNLNATYFDKDGKVVKFGPGMTDGLGVPNNVTYCAATPDLGSQKMFDIFSNPKNCSPPMAPANMPHLWGATRLEWVQWVGFVHSTLGRNFGQSQGTFSKNWYDEDADGKPIFRSSSNIPNIVELEKFMDKLQPPRWQELIDAGVIPKLTEKEIEAQNLAINQGQKVYKENCQSCHAIQPEPTPPNKYGYSFLTVKNIAPEVIGTDPTILEQMATRLAVLPELVKADFIAAFGADSVKENNLVGAFLYRSFIITQQITTALARLKYTPLQQLQASGCRERKVQKDFGYKARSLEGILFTAPFLHNGSVPTFMDLLSPAEQRPKEFYLGCRDYNIKKMGFLCKKSTTGAYKYDTRVAGLSNSGHEYGVDLSLRKKYALIEYMKTLTAPERPKAPEGAPCGP